MNSVAAFLPLFALCGVAAGTEHDAAALVREALEVNLTRAREMAEMPGVVEAIYDVFTSGDSSYRRSRGVVALAEIGKHNPTRIFTPEKVDRISAELLQCGGSDDDPMVMSIAQFIEQAARIGRLWRSDEVRGRLVQAMSSPPLGRSSGATMSLGYVLVRLAPEDESVLQAIRDTADRYLDGLNRHSLKAASGDAESLRAIVDALALEDTMTDDLTIAHKRVEIIRKLWHIRDCRALGPMVEFMVGGYPFPSPDGPEFGTTWGPLDVLPVVRKTVAEYPELKSRLQEGFSHGEFMSWWRSEGREMPGLDVRKSNAAVFRRQRLLPSPDVARSPSFSRPRAMAPAHEMQAPPSSGGDALSYLAVALGGALVIAAAGMWLLLRGKASQAGKR